MLSSLQHLCSLELNSVVQDATHVATLLDGINPPELTHLDVCPDSLSPGLMQSILRFTELKVLYLAAGSASRPSLLQLFSLTTLEELRLLGCERDDSGQFTDAVWETLKSEILEALDSLMQHMRLQAGLSPFYM